MTKVQIHIIVATLFFLVSSSCTEADVFHSIDFETSGIRHLHDSDVDNVVCYGDIPGAGCVVTFKATGKYRDKGYLNNISHNHVADAPVNDNSWPPTFEGDWGYTFVLSTNPPTTQVIFFPNNSGREITHTISFGNGDTMADYNILQPSL